MSDRLDAVEIAAPCQASWDAMSGDDRVRFCGLCSLNVYDLSSLTRDEAERFVGAAEGRACVRFFRRPDGKVMTRDCPVGLAARARRHVRLAAAALVGFLGLGSVSSAVFASATPWRRPLLVRWIARLWGGDDQVVMGRMRCPPGGF